MLGRSAGRPPARPRETETAECACAEAAHGVLVREANCEYFRKGTSVALSIFIFMAHICHLRPRAENSETAGGGRLGLSVLVLFMPLLLFLFGFLLVIIAFITSVTIS